MPLLTLETWNRFQAEGRRRFINRRLKLGAGVGLIAAALAAIVAALDGKRPVSYVALLLIMIGYVLVLTLANLLWGLLIWELLRRKFSPR